MFAGILHSHWLTRCAEIILPTPRKMRSRRILHSQAEGKQQIGCRSSVDEGMCDQAGREYIMQPEFVMFFVANISFTCKGPPKVHVSFSSS